MNLLILSVAVLTVLWSIDESVALSCLPCDRSKCQPLPKPCKGSVGKDICGCCPRCKKVLGEKCDGPFKAFGICDEGLECGKKEVGVLPFNAKGICVCPIVHCKRYCRHGYVKDKNGCKTCHCKLPKCKVMRRHRRYHNIYSRKCYSKKTIFCNRWNCNRCCVHYSTCRPNHWYVRKAICRRYTYGYGN